MFTQSWEFNTYGTVLQCSDNIVRLGITLLFRGPKEYS